MIDRIKQIMEMERLTSSQFADEINIQRSSMSHVLLGRNKPSLDFVKKIKATFNKISLDWLLLGEGSMFVSQQENMHSIEDKDSDEKVIGNQLFKIDANTEVKSSETFENNDSFELGNQDQKQTGKARKIIIFYSDGTFEEFNSK